MSNYTLLTGATGLVGQFLLKDLLLAGHRVALIVRPSKKQTVHERLESTLRMWEQDGCDPLPRPVCLSGDIAEKDYALGGDALRWLRTHCDRVIHNAAAVKFHASTDGSEPWRTNVDGTQHLLDLCRSAKISELHYVSTAYVCGDRHGTIYEHELDMGQEFRNDYEQSKFLAEKMIRAADFPDSRTIYRPPVIAGDSRTGYTSQYHGIYMYLRLMAMFLPLFPKEDGLCRVPFSMDFDPDEQRNVVPVDWVSAVIAQLVGTPAAHGLVYHLSPQVPITPNDIIQFGCSYFGVERVEFDDAFLPEIIAQLPVTDEEVEQYKSMVRGYLANYEPYHSSDPTFDATNLNRFAGGLPCPPIDEGMIHRSLDFCDKDKWGKARPARLDIPAWASEFLPRSDDDQAANGQNLRTVGLDIVGAGGGQWCLRIGQAGTSLSPGLPAGSSPVLRLPAKDFVALKQGAQQFSREQAERHLVSGTIDEANTWEAVLDVLAPVDDVVGSS